MMEMEMIAITNVEHFTALNTEQMRPQTQPQEQSQKQEEVRHIGVGTYNMVTKAWQEDDISPVINAEECYSGAGEWDIIRKCWI